LCPCVNRALLWISVAAANSNCCITFGGGLLCKMSTTLVKTFDVPKSVHYHTIQINKPTRCNRFTSLLLDVYVWLNTFRAPLRPSSGAYNCTRSLWFYCWSVVVGATNNAPTVKPEAPSAVVCS